MAVPTQTAMLYVHGDAHVYKGAIEAYWKCAMIQIMVT